jgi:hypothetical protein
MRLASNLQRKGVVFAVMQDTKEYAIDQLGFFIIKTGS